MAAAKRNTREESKNAFDRLFLAMIIKHYWNGCKVLLRLLMRTKIVMSFENSLQIFVIKSIIIMLKSVIITPKGTKRRGKSI